MKKANADIRAHARQSGVYLYEIADRLSLNDGNFSRLLRVELSAAKKAKVMGIITELVDEHERATH